MKKNNKKAEILFFIEHKDRELYSACAIANELKQNYNVSVKIVSMIFHLFILMIKERPKLIVLPYVKSEKNEVVQIFKALFGSRLLFVNLNYEQIINHHLKQFKKPKDEFAKKELIQFCWGSDFKQYYLNLNVKDSNIYVTGKPDNTILKKMKQNQQPDLKEKLSKQYEGLDLNKNWLFFPMADTFIFSPNNVKKNIKSGKWKRDILIGYRDYLFNSVNTIIDWLCKIENTEYSQNNVFIVRPHPAVAIEEYYKLFNEKLGHVPDFVFLSRYMTVKEWLLVCDKCYSNYSTVLLDALFINIPAYLIKVNSMPQFAEMDWFNNISNINNYEEFTSSILYSNEFVNSKLIDRYIDTEKDAIVETAMVLNKLISKKNYPKSTFSNKVICALKCYPIYLKSLIRIIFIKINFNIFLKNVKYDYFNKKEVTAILEQLPHD
ncbi:MAG: hypothetical protein HQ541_15500 [Mariniphaga sp.]|nr:hypothetical protein [Mariniphaga sp.]